MRRAFRVTSALLLGVGGAAGCTFIASLDDHFSAGADGGTMMPGVDARATTTSDASDSGAPEPCQNAKGWQLDCRFGNKGIVILGDAPVTVPRTLPLLAATPNGMVVAGMHASSPVAYVANIEDNGLSSVAPLAAPGLPVDISYQMKANIAAVAILTNVTTDDAGDSFPRVMVVTPDGTPFEQEDVISDGGAPLVATRFLGAQATDASAVNVDVLAFARPDAITFLPTTISLSYPFSTPVIRRLQGIESTFPAAGLEINPNNVWYATDDLAGSQVAQSSDGKTIFRTQSSPIEILDVHGFVDHVVGGGPWSISNDSSQSGFAAQIFFYDGGASTPVGFLDTSFDGSNVHMYIDMVAGVRGTVAASVSQSLTNPQFVFARFVPGNELVLDRAFAMSGYAADVEDGGEAGEDATIEDGGERDLDSGAGLEADATVSADAGRDADVGDAGDSGDADGEDIDASTLSNGIRIESEPDYLVKVPVPRLVDLGGVAQYGTDVCASVLLGETPTTATAAVICVTYTAP